MSDDTEPEVAAAETEDEFQADIAAEVRAQRGRADISQEELAERSGLSTSTIQRVERGDHRMDYPTIRALCTPLGLTVPELYARALQFGALHGAGSVTTTMRAQSPNSIEQVEIKSEGDVTIEQH